MNQDSGELESTEFLHESFNLQEITWKIPNALAFPDEVDYMEESPTFAFAGADWKIRLYPFGRTEYNTEGYIDLIIVRLSSRFTEHKVNYKFCFQNKDGKEFESYADCVTFTPPDPRGLGVIYFMKNSALKDMKDNLAPNDTLIIVCQIKKVEVLEGYPHIDAMTSFMNYSPAASSTDESSDELSGDEEDKVKEVPSSNDKDSSRAASSSDESSDELSNNEGDKAKEVPSSNDKGLEILSNNLKQVFLDCRMSDTVLKADGKDFHVHKVVLVARSPVFASMFQHDLAEKKTNEVDIPDCTAESFEAFLHYLYTGNVETLSTSNVYNVYYAADKYQVDDLKDKCVKFMIKYISVETFCDVMDLSLRHGESELQNIAVDFFCQNNKEIIKTVQWLMYMEANTVQANELFIKALKA